MNPNTHRLPADERERIRVARQEVMTALDLERRARIAWESGKDDDRVSADNRMELLRRVRLAGDVVRARRFDALPDKLQQIIHRLAEAAAVEFCRFHGLDDYAESHRYTFELWRESLLDDFRATLQTSFLEPSRTGPFDPDGFAEAESQREAEGDRQYHAQREEVA